MKLFNCLTLALSQWLNRNNGASRVPRYVVAYESGDALTVRDRMADGRVKTTTYHKKGEAYE